MESRVIQLTQGAYKNGYLSVRPCGRDFFPPYVFGESSQTKGRGTTITLKVRGLNEQIKTDIPTDRITGKPRWIFRKRSWVKKFMRFHNLKTGDKLTINRINNNTYEVIPDNNHGTISKGKQKEIADTNKSKTREEHRVGIYSKCHLPTKANEVKHNTPLESLNLNWSEKDLPERERTKHVHRLHPYLGKFIPQLVEIFLRKFFSKGQTILDPFVGSGTASVQANELGINSIGYDVSVFNIMLSMVKTARYDCSKARSEVLDILKKVRLETQTDKRQANLFVEELLDGLKGSLYETDNEYLKQWFAPQSLGELLAYRYFIERGEYQYKDLLKIILSRSARSARLTTHFDLDFPKKPQKEPYWCYKHSRTCSPTKDAFKFLHRYSFDTLRRIEEFAHLRTEAIVKLYHADSRKMKIEPVDGIITSPPYVGLIDYHEQHAYSYHLLGLPRNCHNEIGAASKGRSEEAKRQYKDDIAQVFRRALKMIPSGGRLIVIAHDRSYLYNDIAKLIGVEIESIVKRHVNRRTGRRANSFFESVFVWRKA